MSGFDRWGHRMSDPISAAITASIRDARGIQGITRDELAAAARSAGAPESFTTAALRNIEIGRRAVTLDELVWLAAAVKTSVRELLGEHADLFGANEKVLDCGEVEAATRNAVQGLADLPGKQLALAQDAYVLARTLDAGAGMAAAAVSKELRAVLAEIWESVDSDDEDEDDLGAD